MNNRFSIIGGRWAENYITNIPNVPGAEVINICRRNPHNFPSHYQYYKQYSNYKDAINNDIDSVVIATSPSSHFEIAQYALRLRKNVIMEKGSVLSVPQWTELKHLAEHNKVNLFINYIHLWNSGFVDFAARVENIYDIPSVNSIVYNNSPRRETSIIDDYYCHDLAMLFSIFPKIKLYSTLISILEGDGFKGFLDIISYFKDCNNEIRFSSIVINNSPIKTRIFEVQNTTGGFFSEWASWKDDFKGNSLRNMLIDFCSSKNKNNIGLAARVSEALNFIKSARKYNEL